ncbi:clavesin-2 [Caerostris darwini]|uniref:Clavesin-2 n=1 Tax=Caerostris darwini TaxID=1538125 RepID=A0AAV4US00_9ARAC|nr:clavesin-2 [Caerostris darwini]
MKYLPHDETTLNASLLQKVNEELNESEESKSRCLQQLREKLLDLKDFEPNLDEEFLLRFLRVAKFNIVKAFARLQDYHKVQDKYIDFFKNCSLPIAKARKQRFLWILSQRPQDGSLVLISEMGKVDHSNLSVEEMAYLPLIIGETLLKNPSTQKCGMSVIVDASGFQYRNVFHYTPKIIRFYFEVVLKALPIRLASYHVVNMPSIASSLINFCLGFVPKKLKNRIFVYPKGGNWNHLHERIPPEILPEHYGGLLKKSCMVDLLGGDGLIEAENYFRELMRYGSTKTKHKRLAFRLITRNI